MSFEAQAEQTGGGGRQRVSFNIENLRQKKDKSPEEEAYLVEYDKARAERKKFEARAGERDESQIKTVREQVARVQEPHETEHPVQFFKATDLKAAVAKKEEEEKKKGEGNLRRRIKMLGQFFRSK